MKSGFARLLLAVLGLLPLRLARVIGVIVGELNWRFKTKASQVASTNLQLCFPNLSAQQQQELLRQSMHEWGKTVLELPVIWYRSADWLKAQMTEATNQHLMDEALASGKGIILLGPHLGNWEVGGLYASTLKDMTTLYQPPRQKELEALIKRARSRSGAKLVPTDRRGVLALVKALRNGELSGILPDQEPDLSGGVFVPFFGIQAFTMTLLQNLLRSTGAVVLVAAAKRVPKGFKMVYLEPDEEIYSPDKLAATAAMNRSVEKIVSLFPEQYQWEYKRFKRRPPGEDKIYKKAN